MVFDICIGWVKAFWWTLALLMVNILINTWDLTSQSVLSIRLSQHACMHLSIYLLHLQLAVWMFCTCLLNFYSSSSRGLLSLATPALCPVWLNVGRTEIWNYGLWLTFAAHPEYTLTVGRKAVRGDHHDVCGFSGTLALLFSQERWGVKIWSRSYLLLPSGREWEPCR